MSRLTTREHECLYWVSLGKTSWEIGRILGITPRTVNFHMTNTCEKLQVCSRQAAIATAMRQNLLIEPPSVRPTPRPAVVEPG